MTNVSPVVDGAFLIQRHTYLDDRVKKTKESVSRSKGGKKRLNCSGRRKKMRGSGTKTEKGRDEGPKP